MIEAKGIIYKCIPLSFVIPDHFKPNVLEIVFFCADILSMYVSKEINEKKLARRCFTSTDSTTGYKLWDWIKVHVRSLFPVLYILMEL
jgi:hypothetical protein